ncbi:cupin domain-containing protein [Mucilaginibacter psychrotolerans]|uniref:Cupin domain-containing protein n=1 Tax=Mucilaginibacter psychrotolerans TaxID=1524096 RepID=A0A4Y8S992_9SPHI|nr:cupin domain-containing protein [Mucilaginibacter psychrotolerans]TFF35231.1 cupin domain-containing protein [Mucilaginibacter psychrotolerans]
MQRRKFLTTTALATLLVGGAKNLFAKTAARAGFVIRKGKSRFNEHTIITGNCPVDIKVSAKDTGGALTVNEYTGLTKGGPPLHIHPAQDEVFYVMEGEHLFQLGNEQFYLHPGDTIFIPRNTPHAPCQLSDSGKYLFFFTPSGKMEDFFRALSQLKPGFTAAEATKIFESHDMKIVGPPVSPK